MSELNHPEDSQNPESQLGDANGAEALRNASGESREAFGALLAQYERSHLSSSPEGGRQIQGTVISVSADQVFLDIGFKTEGVLPLASLAGEEVKPGDAFPVTVKGRNEEGYYQLSRLKIAQPTDWASLQRAFDQQETILGSVTAVVKGGLSVDVGVRAFLPASRSGTRDAVEMAKLVGQEIRCRILKLEATEEDVVLDRRVLAEEEERARRERRFSEVREGETVQG